MRLPALARHRYAPCRHCLPMPSKPPQEGIQIGLSTDRVAITADFSGADLTIFGALENADPLVSRQGRYDVIVVLEGPARSGRRPPQGPRARRVDQHRIGNLRQRAGVLFDGDHAPAAGHHRSEQLQQLSLGINNIYIAAGRRSAATR